MGLSLLILGAAFHFGVEGIPILLIMLLCMFSFQVTVAPLTWVIMAEIFPTRLRAKGMGIASNVLWISAFVIFYLFPVLTEFFETRLGTASGLFWSFVPVCGVAFYFCLKLVPETKDRTLEEIARSWNPSKGREEP